MRTDQRVRRMRSIQRDSTRTPEARNKAIERRRIRRPVDETAIEDGVRYTRRSGRL